MARTKSVDLSPVSLNVTIYRGHHTSLLVGRRDKETQVFEDLSAWSNFAARFRPERGTGTAVPFTAAIEGTDRVRVTISEADIDLITTSVGVWEVEGDDGSGFPQKLVHGKLTVNDEVAAE